jgi:diguanylate cyclase (GGDEF)-like protein
MMDVDFFKKINDSHGHLAGDKVLKLLGQVLTKQLRLENIACRFGGEEFGIILRGANPEMALQVGERIRKQVEIQKVSYRNREFQFTVSVGIATFDGKNFSTSEELMQKADELLYQAKQQGRNRTFANAA